MKNRLRAAAAALALAFGGAAYAGPYILAGTDADDHGFASTTANLEGWLFMQKALENLAASSSFTGTHTVYSLGSDTGQQAGLAAASAFQFSSLASAGWTFVSVPNLTDAAMDAALAGGGIIMLDSSDNNVSGGLNSTERGVLASHASAINAFVGAGNGLFSQANGYSWLSALIPTLSVVESGNTGLTLTAAGMSAFPGLSDADLSAGPWHENFVNVGSIPVLANGVFGSTVPVIIGAAGGSITNPTNPIPEPETYALMIAGLAALGVVSRRRKSRA